MKMKVPVVGGSEIFEPLFYRFLFYISVAYDTISYYVS